MILYPITDNYAVISPRVGYTHIKDAVCDPGHPQATEDGWHYVFPGEGQVPLADAIRLFRDSGYSGWLQFEHEKRWHPELAETEDIFPAFGKRMRSVLG